MKTLGQHKRAPWPFSYLAGQKWNSTRPMKLRFAQKSHAAPERAQPEYYWHFEVCIVANKPNTTQNPGVCSSVCCSCSIVFTASNQLADEILIKRANLTFALERRIWPIRFNLIAFNVYWHFCVSAIPLHWFQFQVVSFSRACPFYSQSTQIWHEKFQHETNWPRLFFRPDYMHLKTLLNAEM